MTYRKTILGGCALAALLLPLAAAAQNQTGASVPTEDSTPDPDTIARANDIIVTGNIEFRNRTDAPNPVLAYDLEYFQRFEPVSVGEMLKRVPGVTFTSDVLEYDSPQFRGLPPGYTQILINGRRAPGGEADRSFFVDRIPAELVERIELVRSPTADQPSEGVAGTLNIITKESTTFEGGFLKAGALMNRDGKVRPSVAGAYAGRLGENTTFWGALNYQERRNPKKKVSLRFDDVTDGPLDETNPVFKDTELQADTRDGSDFSGSGEIKHNFGDRGFLRLQGFFVDTNRDENETSLTYAGSDLDFDGVETQHEDIHQQTYEITSDARIPLGETLDLGLAGGWSGYREKTDTVVMKGDEEDLSDLELDEEDSIHIKDDEYTGTVNLGFGSKAAKVKIGTDLMFKRRDGLNDGDFLSGDFSIKEDRYSPYAKVTLTPAAGLTIDGGVRYEITRRTVEGLVENEDGDDVPVRVKYNDESLNPSLHFRFTPNDHDQFRASIARTVRRPGYDDISPSFEREAPGDGDITYGNPELRNEKSWGVDLGYERRFAGQGIFGVNVFYRDITDVIELVNFGDVTAPDEDDVDEDGDTDELIATGNKFTPRNIGDGKTWGVEVDFSAPLTFMGLPDTGVFANYTYLDSSIRDPDTGEKRRFNNQPHHVYNVGFIHTLRTLDASFGATISGRTKASASNFDETVDLRYGDDLEAFVEKRLGKNFVLRFSVQDILQRTKYEDFRKYDGDNYQDILDNRAAGDVDEYELEREHAGPLYQFTIRAAF